MSYQCISPKRRLRDMVRKWSGFYSEELQYLVQTPPWKTTPSWLSANAYLIYWQLPALLESVPPSGTDESNRH